MTAFALGDNTSGLPVAVVASDIVAHSMGGLLIRMWTTYANYHADNNYGQGAVHKLITLGTPHFGTPQATLTLLPQTSCSRGLAADVGSLAFATATLTGSNQVVLGAAGELSGDGIGRAGLSPALQTIMSSKVNIPIATVAADAGSLDVLLDNISNGASAVRNKCFLESDPLAERHTSALFDTIFDPNILNPLTGFGSQVSTRNDGSVPLTSSLLNATITTCNLPSCFSGYTHSVGIAQLFGVFPFYNIPYLQWDGSQQVVVYVETLLNTSIRNQIYLTQ